ncbi:hypothetical protein Taro_051811 [Colocasia esculenta]|uniref:Uncharacterized protein n=1 Tax=Colocasia esculenta TaxID=4460 RepID=A0A843XGX8_COLES|nr:hypothetical protein [Colocasia esculenta]
MQGLVQAMQTQAHTQAALQAQLEAQQAQVRTIAQVPVPQAQDHGGPSIMEWFKGMSPPSFKGESNLLLAESWLREIEKIFRAIRCAEDDRVTLATYMLQRSVSSGGRDGAVLGGEEGFVEEASSSVPEAGEKEGGTSVTAVSRGIGKSSGTFSVFP